MPVVLIGLSHHTSPVALRERFAFTESEATDALAKLRGAGLAREGVILSTCNRVELYAAVARPETATLAALGEFLAKHRGQPVPAGDELRLLSEPDSITHLFRVACGLESMVLGETEVLGQLKKAYDVALRHQHTGPELNRAFQKAFNVAKCVRTETNIQRGNISVASVAVDLAERIFDTLGDRPVLVIGAGDTSEKTARALLSRGAREITVTNRSPERASALAATLGGRAVPFADWTRELLRVDIVISSTAAPSYVLHRAALAPLLKERRHRPLLLIDIAVPRNLDPALNDLDNVYLYNIDDLQAIADDSLQQRREEISRCEALIRERVAALLRAPTSPSPPRSPGDAALQTD